MCEAPDDDEGGPLNDQALSNQKELTDGIEQLKVKEEENKSE